MDACWVKVRNFNKEIWEQVIEGILFECLMAKFTQNLLSQVPLQNTWKTSGLLRRKRCPVGDWDMPFHRQFQLHRKMAWEEPGGCSTDESP